MRTPVVPLAVHVTLIEPTVPVPLSLRQSAVCLTFSESTDGSSVPEEPGLPAGAGSSVSGGAVGVAGTLEPGVSGGALDDAIAAELAGGEAVWLVSLPHAANAKAMTQRIATERLGTRGAEPNPGRATVRAP
jgi:hypothetical protein